MSSLSDLPDDILGLISCLLNGFDNCSLWMASDSKLRQRLVDNVITEFNIKYTVPGRYLWPGNFLKKLQRISRLSLVVTHLHLPIENIELFPIPTLKYFEIECPSLRGILEEPTGKLDHRWSAPARNVILRDLYPNLEHFKISEQHDFQVDFFQNLPQNLKSLSLASIPPQPFEIGDPKRLDSYIEALPRSLTQLSLISAGNQLHFDAGLLPSELTSLVTNAIIKPESYPHIPNTLTHFDSCSAPYDLEKLGPSLPSGTQRLSLITRHFSSDWISHLEYLKSLELVISSGPSFMVPQPTLLKLKPFPYGLFELTLKADRGNVFNREFFQTLPGTLNKLVLTDTAFSDEIEFLTLLPKYLKTLSINLPIIENLSLLPESLTYFQLSTQIRPQISHFDRLPPNLETLIFHGVQVNLQSILKVLPQKLKWLDVESRATIIDDEIIACLPRGLKHLFLNSIFCLTDSIELPPDLEYLSLIGNCNLTNDVIPNLPRSLTHLELPRANLTDECIRHMPRNLFVLAIQSCKGVITPKCSKDLPRHLSFLSIPGASNWIPEELEDPPKHVVMIAC